MMLLYHLSSEYLNLFIKEKLIQSMEIKSITELSREEEWLGGVIHISSDDFSELAAELIDLSDNYLIAIVKENGKIKYLHGGEGERNGLEYVLSSHFKMASITYSHELNNHLAIVNGRLYELKKLAKGLERSDDSEKLVKAVASIEDKVNKITNLSRLMTKRNSSNSFFGGDELIEVDKLINSISYDYRKVFEKYKNEVTQTISEVILKKEVADIVEQFIIALSIKFASQAKFEESTSKTEISYLKLGENDKLIISFQGEFKIEVDYNLPYHQNWLNALNSLAQLGFEINQRVLRNKVEVSIDIPNRFILNKL